MEQPTTTQQTELFEMVHELSIKEFLRLEQGWRDYPKEDEFAKAWARARESMVGIEKINDIVYEHISEDYPLARLCVVGLVLAQQCFGTLSVRECELLAGPWTLAWTTPYKDD